jgi:hypothetical protein
MMTGAPAIIDLILGSFIKVPLVRDAIRVGERVPRTGRKCATGPRRVARW